ncbi:hypothetical protein [Tsukamurella ocularis]|uniref:hypothetical protein n=1 Tax=Tsukamurella ocularis TaxID=1970234 RepID=UPI0021693BA4|nr:hypothetical protein [Tsukamurella ocularis]MCS3781202.1 hypothetical protein [Tsukamurella ocularis]MCS3787026.1 hypothetical protein [Tsukamurella ocularis]MCS3850868.1 hypothetical protein [Tsukamurella ocularis]
MLRTSWAVPGVAFLAVLIGLASGAGAFLISGTAPASRPDTTSASPQVSPAAIALKAADDSRTMFSLLSDALTSSSTGLMSATSAIPQIFDSLARARAGAADLATSLESTSSASQALTEVTEVTSTWSNSIEQATALASLSTSVRTSLRDVRTRLAPSTNPTDVATRERIDAVLDQSAGLDALQGANALRSALASLSSASSRGSAGLTSARTAARQLRDGLTTMTSARPAAEAAVAKLNLGVRQLGIALQSIDRQLETVQTQLRADSTTHSTADTALTTASVATTSSPDRLAYAVLTGAVGAVLVYLSAALITGRRRRTVVATAPLANVARAYASDSGTGALSTDPNLPVLPPRPDLVQAPGTADFTAQSGTDVAAPEPAQGLSRVPSALDTGPVLVHVQQP